MEKLKVKHDHKLTDILKVCIFAIFLLFPFFTYAPNALYYGVNEYATNNTTTNVDIQYKYETNNVNNIDDLVEGNIYHLTIDDKSADEFLNSNGYFYCYLVNVNSYDFSSYSSMLDDVITTSYVDNGDVLVQFVIEDGWVCYFNTFLTFNNDNDPFSQITFDEDLSNFTFSLDADIVLGSFSSFYGYTILSESDFNVIESVDVEENIEQTISQQMYNSWKTMWETPMYNWTNNSILKTGLDNFTNVFAVNNNSYITNLIAYELIMVAIYIIIDIVLTLFKWLTHMVGSKE